MSLKHSDWPERLWIVRHGQSAGNAARDDAEARGLGLIDIQTRDADTPLSQLGQQQAEALAHWFSSQPPHLRPTCYYSSPFVRSMDTCRAIANALGKLTGAPLRTLPMTPERVWEHLQEQQS